MNRKLYFSLAKTMKWCSREGEYGGLKNITKMQARRLTPIGKIIIDMAIGCIKEDSIDYIIYSSRHGELKLSVDLIQMIYQGEMPSPIKFSQSTHNSIMGQLCIQSKKKLPVSAISAGKKSFEMGLVAACNHLLSSPQEKVLFIFADAALPELYKDKVRGEEEDLVFCAILKEGYEYFVDLSEGGTNLNV